MKVALEFWSSSYDQTEATCRRAEVLGFDAFYYGESPHDLNLDCWTTLAALARATTTIRLGPVITNVLPTYRSDVLLARQATTVDAISGGRLDLRTGAGASTSAGRRWWEPFGVTYPGYDERLVDLERVVTALPSVPLTLAATGERAMRLAAIHADVWETSFCTPGEFRERNAVFGRLTGDRAVLRSLEIDGFVATSEQALSTLLERVQRERGPTEDLDPVFERALLGTPERVRRQLSRLADAGVDQVVVALHDPHDDDALRALARSRQEN